LPKAGSGRSAKGRRGLASRRSDDAKGAASGIARASLARNATLAASCGRDRARMQALAFHQNPMRRQGLRVIPARHSHLSFPIGGHNWRPGGSLIPFQVAGVPILFTANAIVCVFLIQRCCASRGSTCLSIQMAIAAIYRFLCRRRDRDVCVLERGRFIVTARAPGKSDGPCEHDKSYGASGHEPPLHVARDMRKW
jgi:hypothetical protein